MLKQGSIKALMGLIEVRLRCLEITDREDKREMWRESFAPAPRSSRPTMIYSTEGEQP